MSQQSRPTRRNTCAFLQHSFATPTYPDDSNAVLFAPHNESIVYKFFNIIDAHVLLHGAFYEFDPLPCCISAAQPRRRLYTTVAFGPPSVRHKTLARARFSVAMATDQDKSARFHLPFRSFIQQTTGSSSCTTTQASSSRWMWLASGRCPSASTLVALS